MENLKLKLKTSMRIGEDEWHNPTLKWRAKSDLFTEQSVNLIQRNNENQIEENNFSREVWLRSNFAAIEEIRTGKFSTMTSAHQTWGNLLQIQNEKIKA